MFAGGAAHGPDEGSVRQPQIWEPVAESETFLVLQDRERFSCGSPHYLGTCFFGSWVPKPNAQVKASWWTKRRRSSTRPLSVARHERGGHALKQRMCPM